MSASMLRLLLAAAVVPLVGAAPVNQSWDVLVAKLKPKEKVVVNRMNTGTVEGKLVEINAGAITVKWHGKPERIAREEVYRVRIADVRLHRTLIGMAVGATVGAATFRAACKSSSCGSDAIVGVIFGTGFGALGGAVIPNRAPLYEAAKPRRASRAVSGPEPK